MGDGQRQLQAAAERSSPVPLETEPTTILDEGGLLEQLAVRHQEGMLQIKMLVAGGVAGCVAKTAVAPLSRVTILMQVQSMRPHKYATKGRPNNTLLFPSLRKIVRQEGYTALWRGNGATLVHRFPYSAVTFYANTWARRHLETGQLAVWFPQQAHAFVAGGVSACLGVTLCYPLDVVKTRLTAQTKRKYYKGIFHALQTIYFDEGYRGMYRGLGMSLCSTVPMLSFNFAFYERFLHLYSGFGFSPYLHSVLAGGSSGALASTLIFPIDLLRRQMQLVGLGGRPVVYSSVFQAVQHIYTTGCSSFVIARTTSPACASVGPPGLLATLLRPIWGFREFFRGLMPEILKVAPNNAILFSVHAQLLRWRWPWEAFETYG